jgi:hypothetical protein
MMFRSAVSVLGPVALDACPLCAMNQAHETCREPSCTLGHNPYDFWLGECAAAMIGAQL